MLKSPKITFKVKGSARLQANLTKSIVALSNRSEPHQETVTWFKQRWTENFMGQGSIYGGGGGWTELAEKTLKDREVMGVTTSQMLSRFGGDYSAVGRPGDYPGRLLDQLLSEFDDVEVALDSTKWTFPNEAPRYLLSHHFGQSVNDMPPRPLWGINIYDENRVFKIFEKFVYDALRRIW